jgi:putative tricarboxylic transport membrane protein
MPLEFQPFIIDSLVLQQTGEFSEAIRIALRTLIEPRNILLILLATVFGLITGALPGMGGPVAIALLIPLTFRFDPNVAIMTMAATLGGTAFGGSITAILLNTPGDAPNAATLLDGYPMARQGRGNEALVASAISSATGALVGVGLLLITIPFMYQLVLAFGPPEIFWLALLGLTTIAVATHGSVLKDLIAGAFGLMLAFHGLNRVTGSARFTWDTTYLLDGLPIVPVLIGLFAIAEMVNIGTERETISESGELQGGWSDGYRSVAKNKSLLLRSSVIGWIIGVVPGAGGTVANFVAYLQAKETEEDGDTFGSGNVKGVIASESSNDAKDGGSMLPTLGLGIPGSASTAVLLGAFITHGLDAGPLLFRDNLQIVFIIIFTLIISNITTSLVGLVSANQLTKITQIEYTVVVPAVITVALVGSFVIRSNILDVFTAGLFGIIGFYLMKYNISRVPIVIALVLGQLAESNFHRSLQIARGDYLIFITNPLSLALVLATLAVILYPLYKSYRNSQNP